MSSSTSDSSTAPTVCSFDSVIKALLMVYSDDHTGEDQPRTGLRCSLESLAHSVDYVDPRVRLLLRLEHPNPRSCQWRNALKVFAREHPTRFVTPGTWLSFQHRSRLVNRKKYRRLLLPSFLSIPTWNCTRLFEQRVFSVFFSFRRCLYYLYVKDKNLLVQ